MTRQKTKADYKAEASLNMQAFKIERQARQGLEDMLEDAREELRRLRVALKVPYEPHQNLHERMIEAAAAPRLIGSCKGGSLNDSLLVVVKDALEKAVLGLTSEQTAVLRNLFKTMVPMYKLEDTRHDKNVNVAHAIPSR